MDFKVDKCKLMYLIDRNIKHEYDTFGKPLLEVQEKMALK